MTSGLAIDTNVVVSAQLKPQGNEAVVLTLALREAGPFQWYASEAILAEYQRALHYKKFPISKSQVERLLTLIGERVTIVKPTVTISECNHEPDNRFLECADAAKADYIVTGNAKHFPNHWKTTKIINARELLQLT